jgi:DNA-binding response OmpR family regulator
MTATMDPDRSSLIRIWIAEDDEELREILGAQLAGDHREIHTFENGEAVLHALRAFSPPDLLLTDLMMPGVDGIELLREVKHTHSECAVIIMTGYASVDTAIQAIRGGAYDYIRKPFKLEELEIVIHQACEKLFLLRENRSLLIRLREAMEELEDWRRNREAEGVLSPESCKHLTPLERFPEWDILLRQASSGSPDDGGTKQTPQQRAMEQLERLIQFKKEGFLSESEFVSFKKSLMKNLDTD